MDYPPIFPRLFQAGAILCGILLLGASLRADEAADFAARAQVLINYAADTYQASGGTNPYSSTSFSDYERYTGPKILARMWKYGPTDTAGAARGTFSSNNSTTNANTWLDEGAKKSNFYHFRFPAVARALWQWPTAPGVVDNQIAYLNFIFNRVDNYNAFTGEGTENHLNMNRTSAFLFASLAAAHPEGATRWPTAGARRAEMRQWILEYARLVLRGGMGEWDSDKYAMTTAKGWLNVYDFTAPGSSHADAEAHAAARAVLDYLAATLALKHHRGKLAGASMRANGPGTSASTRTEPLLWLWFSTDTSAPSWLSGNSNNFVTVVYAAISAYRPPAAVLKLARRQVGLPQAYVLRRSGYNLTRLNETHEEVWLGPNYTLGFANHASGGWSAGMWDAVNWLLLIDPASGFPAAVFGNSEFRGSRSARNRNPWDQFTGHRNTVIQLSRVPPGAATQYSAVQALYQGWADSWDSASGGIRDRFNPIDRGGYGGMNSTAGNKTPINFQTGTVAASGSTADALRSVVVYPSGATVTTDAAVANGWFVEYRDVYLCVRSIRLATPVHDSANRYFLDEAAEGQLFGLITEVGSKVEHGSLAAFKTQIATATSLALGDRDSAYRVVYSNSHGDRIDATYGLSGTFREPEYDWGFGPTEPQVSQNTALWGQPSWPVGEGHGRIPTVSVNHQAVADGPTQAHCDGPNVQVRDGVLRVRDDLEVYTVDASGEVPAFRTAPTYAGWAARPENAGLGQPGDDPDADHLPNLLEFAFGTNPLTANAPPASYRQEIVRDGAQQDWLELTYPVSAEAAAFGLPSVVPEVSSDLETWTAIASEPAGTDAQGRTLRRVRVALTPPEQAARYLHLRLVLP